LNSNQIICTTFTYAIRKVVNQIYEIFSSLCEQSANCHPVENYDKTSDTYRASHSSEYEHGGLCFFDAQLRAARGSRDLHNWLPPCNSILWDAGYSAVPFRVAF